MHNSTCISNSVQNLEKTNNLIPRKDRRTEKRGDGDTLFYRTFPVNAEDPIKLVCPKHNRSKKDYAPSTRFQRKRFWLKFRIDQECFQ